MTQSFLQLGVIGDPIAHSASPQMFNPALKALGINGHYERYHVTNQGLLAFFERLRRKKIHGVNVTLPHKQEVIRFVDELTLAAQHIGAVNTIFWQDNKLVGDNTDGEGFWQSLGNQIPAPNDPILLVGAGGAARAIGYTLLEKGCLSITLVNRDLTKAEALISFWQKKFPSAKLKIQSWPEFLQGDHCQIHTLINSTSLGLENQDSWPHLDFLKTLPARAQVVDIVAKPFETELLKSAKARGLKIGPGWSMLLHQAVLAFERFTSQKAPVMVMKKHLLQKHD